MEIVGIGLNLLIMGNKKEEECMDLAAIVGIAAEYTAVSPLNSSPEMGLERIFAAPLMGVAAAEDLLFTTLKEPGVVGKHHLLPREWLGEARSVLSYFLPFTEKVRKANREAGFPALEWVYGRIEGERFNVALREHLVEVLAQAGIKALCPVLDSRFNVVENRSNWSERHVAYIAGLGTFGLSKSLITKIGCAGRYGSLILDIELEPTPRDYEDVYEYCTMCGECIHRCPIEAIKVEGKETSICSAYMKDTIAPRFFPRYGCGKCQTAVACEDSLP